MTKNKRSPKKPRRDKCEAWRNQKYKILRQQWKRELLAAKKGRDL